MGRDQKDRSVAISSAVCGTAMPFYEEASANGLSISSDGICRKHWMDKY